MNATMMLADSAQVENGKLFILGGGWTFTGPGPSPMAVAAVAEVPWDEANTRHKFTLMLLDEDGHGVELPTPTGMQSVMVEGEFEVGRPPGTPVGSDMNFPIAINFGALPLDPGRRYVWSLQIAEQVWQKTFTTRSDVAAIG